MLKRNRLHYFLSLAIALFLIAVAYATQPVALRDSERETENQCAETFYRIKSDSKGPFFSITRETKPCEKEITTQPNHERAHSPRGPVEADLLAQVQMAHWTKWIGAFTAIGLALLYITFDATRETVVETREIGRKQTRAYLVVSGRIKKLEAAEEGFVTFSIQITVKNNGPSPAILRNFSFIARINPLHNLPVSGEWRPISKDEVECSPNSSSMIMLFVGFPKFAVEDVYNEKCALYVRMEGFYEDVFNEIHLLETILMGRGRTIDDGPLAGQMFAAADLKKQNERLDHPTSAL